MEDTKQQLADKLKSANNILVTVSRNPSVDQLSALLGLTLFLNKQGKHAAAVFSGEVPSTLEFLKPEATIEKTTDSLRDFIIALDKNKADKLRYKVEDNVVRIFITPYKTSITHDDFDFSQGDFNVDVVVAIGVHEQEELDEAITAHGRILHDATVASINTSPDGGLGTMNWHAPEGSSLSELTTELIETVDASQIDEQIATALLTGIVAETDHFRNEKTSPQTMSLSGVLMAAGANQQLVASQLDTTKVEIPEPILGETTDTVNGEDKQHNGTIDIDHTNDPEPVPVSDAEPAESSESTEPAEPEVGGGLSPGGELIVDPPSMGGTLTANSSEEPLDPPTDPLSVPGAETPQLIDAEAAPNDGEPTTAPLAPAPADWTPPAADATTDNASDHTLTELEESVKSPHVDVPTDAAAPADGAVDTEAARTEVDAAITEAFDPATAVTEPIEALNAQPLGTELHNNNDIPAQIDESQLPTDPGMPAGPPAVPTITSATSDSDTPPAPAADPAGTATAQVADPTAPPPVPPPIPFQFGNPPQSQ